jgi:hypothetical protein
MKKTETAANTTSKPVRGKYANLLRKGSNVAVLDPDIALHFQDSAAVNKALRAFLAIEQQVESASVLMFPTSPSARRTPTKGRTVFDPLNASTLKRRVAAK